MPIYVYNIEFSIIRNIMFSEQRQNQKIKMFTFTYVTPQRAVYTYIVYIIYKRPRVVSGSIIYVYRISQTKSKMEIKKPDNCTGHVWTWEEEGTENGV